MHALYWYLRWLDRGRFIPATTTPSLLLLLLLPTSSICIIMITPCWYWYSCTMSRASRRITTWYYYRQTISPYIDPPHDNVEAITDNSRYDKWWEKNKDGDDPNGNKKGRKSISVLCSRVVSLKGCLDVCHEECFEWWKQRWYKAYKVFGLVWGDGEWGLSCRWQAVPGVFWLVVLWTYM